MYFLGMWTPKFEKNFLTHGGIYKLEKIQQTFLREIRNTRGCILEANFERQGW